MAYTVLLKIKTSNHSDLPLDFGHKKRASTQPRARGRINALCIMYSVVRRVTRKGDTPVAYLLLNPHSQTNEGISRNPYEVPTFIAPIHFNAGRFPPVVYKDIHAGATMQTAVIFLQAKPHIHTVRLRIMYQNTLLHSLRPPYTLSFANFLASYTRYVLKQKVLTFIYAPEIIQSENLDKISENPVFSRLLNFCPIITQSSILLTIPVAFIILTPLLLLRTCIVCRLREIMRINEKLNRMAEMYVSALKYYK